VDQSRAGRNGGGATSTDNVVRFPRPRRCSATRLAALNRALDAFDAKARAIPGTIRNTTTAGIPGSIAIWRSVSPSLALLNLLIETIEADCCRSRNAAKRRLKTDSPPSKRHPQQSLSAPTQGAGLNDEAAAQPMKQRPPFADAGVVELGLCIYLFGLCLLQPPEERRFAADHGEFPALVTDARIPPTAERQCDLAHTATICAPLPHGRAWHRCRRVSGGCRRSSPSLAQLGGFETPRCLRSGLRPARDDGQIGTSVCLRDVECRDRPPETF